MFFYAVGLLFLGRLGDQTDLKNFILIGMTGLTFFQFLIAIVGLSLE
jgi:MFS family permease